MGSAPSSSTQPTVARPRFVPVVGPRLKWLLAAVFGLFALLGVNSAYLAAVTFMEWRTGAEFQNYFYLLMFAAHIVMGLLITLPVILFGVFHAKNAANRPNRWAKRVGWALLIIAIVLLATGFALTRLDVGGLTIDIKDPAKRTLIYWAHVIAPLIAIWLFVLHRLAGRRIKWKIGIGWGLVGASAAVGMAAFHSLDPRRPNQPGPKSGTKYFEPSLARTSTGNFIPADRLMMNEYCLECHPDTYRTWQHSMHAISSFNNPFYAFSVLETRRVGHEQEGNVRDARFCAGCHDPVPFFSGAFDEPKWDDPTYDIAKDPLGKASITCTSCHSIVHVDGTRGNGEYTIEEAPHYPFVDSESPFLRWVNRQLIKAKPAFHARTFLKPNVHRTDEFCSTCHKVNLPESINNYKWLRGQNHYDSFRLSGVSGHGIMSWYYPPKAEADCNGCHMAPIESSDFGAKTRGGKLTIADHMFPSANPAVHHVLEAPEGKAMLEAIDALNKGVMRVDIMGVHDGPEIDSPLIAPLRPSVPTLVPGKRYLFDVVTRTVKMGHEFTQGTADSNEIWLDVTVKADGQVIGRSGGLGPDGALDPWSKLFNVFMLDRQGYRIDRRNPQDIFVPLYNNQIPPGAGDVTHFALTIPPDAKGPIEVSVTLRYRKFDTIYMKRVFGADRVNDLPILTLATDALQFPLQTAGTAGGAGTVGEQVSTIDEWQRWYDYGIGLLRTGDRGAGKGELRQSEAAFAKLESIGRAEGALGLARVYLREGRVDEAREALDRAASHKTPAYPWSLAWFSGLVAKQQGNLAEAADYFREVLSTPWPLAKERGFDFSRDERVRIELAETLLELARVGSDQGGSGEARTALLREAERHLLAALGEDVEGASTHFLLAQVYDALGQTVLAERHRAEHDIYRPDDNARDVAVNAARIRYPAADRAAEAVVLYELDRAGAFELPHRLNAHRETPPTRTLSEAEVQRP
jgi:tetratricopeptide (TPR) repeat protein